MKIVAQMVVRNEANRYLDLVIPKITAVVNKLIILDDASTDNTVEICRSFEKTIVYESKQRRGLTDESGLRSELWEHVRGLKPDWVLSLDADEVLDVSDFFDWSEVFLSDKNWFEAHFYEMWNEKQYRADGYWSTTKASIFRFQDCSFGWERRLHCFGIPKAIFRKGNSGLLKGIKIQHLAYLKDEDKKRKYEFYMEQNLDNPINLAHAKTILDEPELRDYNAELPTPIIDKEEN